VTDIHDGNRVTIGEEIQCLLAAGWTWDGDKLMHPGSKETWVRYQRGETSGIGARVEQFESELKQAVREARAREQQTGNSSSGQ
jgi:hypothetical protein